MAIKTHWHRHEIGRFSHMSLALKRAHTLSQREEAFTASRPKEAWGGQTKAEWRVMICLGESSQHACADGFSCWRGGIEIFRISPNQKSGEICKCMRGSEKANVQ